jgi:CRISPR-associated protein Cas2
MATEMLVMVGYDIADAARLRAALKVAKGHALGGQKSFYECWMSGADLRRAISQMSMLIDHREDRVVLLRVDPRGRVETLGVAVAPDHRPVLYLG